MLGMPKYQMINEELNYIFKNIAYLPKETKELIGYFKCDKQGAVSNKELDDLFEIAKFATYFLEVDHKIRPFLILEDDKKKLNADTRIQVAGEIQAIINKWTSQ